MQLLRTYMAYAMLLKKVTDHCNAVGIKFEFKDILLYLYLYNIRKTLSIPPYRLP